MFKQTILVCQRKAIFKEHYEADVETFEINFTFYLTFLDFLVFFTNEKNIVKISVYRIFLVRILIFNFFLIQWKNKFGRKIVFHSFKASFNRSKFMFSPFGASIKKFSIAHIKFEYLIFE